MFPAHLCHFLGELQGLSEDALKPLIIHTFKIGLALDKRGVLNSTGPPFLSALGDGTIVLFQWFEAGVNLRIRLDPNNDRFTYTITIFDRKSPPERAVKIEPMRITYTQRTNALDELTDLLVEREPNDRLPSDFL